MKVEKININLKSVFISGIVAGILILIVGAGLVPIIGNQMDEVLKNRSLPPLSNGAMTYFAIISLVLGISIMGVYAMVRSKFKSNIKAAITVSIIFWFFTYFWSNAALVAYGFMPLRLVVIGTAWGLLELILASIVGSKLYKELKHE